MTKLEFERALAELRRSYIVSLPFKLAELSAAVASARVGGSLLPARAAAHRLRGTAGSYGLAIVSGHLGDVEDALDSIGESEPPPAIWDNVEGSLVAARKAIEEANHEDLAR